ncbi:MAG: DUF5018 domain-containing protein [Bacteroidales bacterium]|nr:DUF5018 domain-containing protein [Bacteroidales bacterium]
MKKITLLSVSLFFILSGLFSQPLLLEENFDYAVGTMLVGTNGWVEQGTSSINEFQIIAGNLSYPSYASSGIGNYLLINNTGEDAYKAFTAQNTGTVYTAFLIRVTDAKSLGDYFFAFQPSPGNTNFTGRFFIKKDATDALAFGISKGTETAVYTGFNYALNTTYLVVIKYQMIAGNQNDEISVFVNPLIPGAEPNPIITTTGGTTTDPTALNTILLRQGSATNAPTLYIDGIRVATTWAEAVKEIDTQPPLVAFNPAGGSTNVPVTVNPVITFSEPIRNIDNSPIDNTNVANLITFKLNNINGANVPFTATIDANKTNITVIPSNQLLYNQTYFLQIAPVEDNFNNATTTLNVTFTTETASTDAEILSFNIAGQISSNINSQQATVHVVMPFGTDVTDLVPNITVSPGASINPPSGSSQNFTNPVVYTVTAQDGITTKQWTVTVSTQLNNEAEILSFTIPGQVSSNIMSGQSAVYVTMPYGTNVTNLIPNITISAGATITPASGTAQNFTNPVLYTVTAQDGITTKVWTVTVTVLPNHEAEITSFTIPGQISSTINSTNATVSVVMPIGTDPSNLTPTITVSAGASISPASGVPQNFSSPVQYTVTAQNGTTTKVWTVTVTVLQPTYITLVEWNFPNNPDNNIADGGIPANLNQQLTTTASGTVNYGAAGATTSAASVSGWDNGANTKYWRIDFTSAGYKDLKFSSKQRSSSTGPKEFKVQYMINNSGNWIDVPGANVTCADNFISGVLNEINLPAACNQQNLVSLRWIMTSNTSVGGGTVGAAGTSRIDDIIVKGIEELNNEAEILSFDIPGQISSNIMSGQAAVVVTMPYGTNVTNLIPTITVSPGATISPASGVAQNFTNPVVYTVTAQNGVTTKQWTVTVNVESPSNAAEILSFTIPGQISSNIMSGQAAVLVTMPYGTDVTNLTPSITVSPGATISPASGVAQNFTNPVVYTVTAQNGTTTKQWTVTVVTQLNNEAEILSFTLPNQVSSVINSGQASVNVLMPYGTDLSSLTPSITVSPGATITPASGVPQNFTNPVVYTVTAQNGTTTKQWTVTVAHDNPVYQTLVEWTFPNNPDDSLADGGITANLDKIITTTATGTLVFNAAGATTSAARATGWDNGADTKYWRVDFTTQGFMMVQFSSKQRSSSTGPKEFKVQYMINNDGNWIDIPGAIVTVADNFTTGVLSNISLPSECDDKALISLRWIMTSNTSVGGATVAAAGASRIDDIIVKGVEIPLSIKPLSVREYILVYPNPVEDILNIYSESSIIQVRLLNANGQVFITTQSNQLNVSHLPSGVYSLLITTQQGNSVVRFIKK